MTHAPAVQITIVVDNRAGPGLAAEHGLSLSIAAGGRHILFDTGQGAALPKNARALDVDLRDIDALVLSHGHYDHTGGIPQVVSASSGIAVYGHPGMVWPRYAIRDGEGRAIHMPQASMVAIDALPSDRMHWLSQPARLWEAFGLTGPIPRKTPYEDPGGPFFLDPEGRRPDAIDDDLALWVQTDEGLVVCVGCCHAGVVNTLSHVQSLNPGSRIRALIGGLHLANASRRRLDQTVAALRGLDLELLAPCHCTGDAAVKILTDALGRRRVSPGAAGNDYRF